MIVEATTSFLTDGAPLAAEARLVVIRDKHGNPLVLARQLDSGQIFVSRAGDPDFNDNVKAAGLDIKTNLKMVSVR